MYAQVQKMPSFLKPALVLVFAAFLVACSDSETVESTEVTPVAVEAVSAPEMETPVELPLKEINKALVAEYIEKVGTPEFAAFRETVTTEDHVRTRREFENLFYNMDGDEALTALGQPLVESLSNRKNTITRLLGQDDLVVLTYRLAATHSGNLYGIPATGKDIDIDATAVARVEDGKIAEIWFMADEAALLRQLGVKLPARADGQINLAPKIGEIRTYDEALAEHLASPEDTPEWWQTRLLLAYKTLPENRPADYQFEGRPYTTYLRSGIVNIVERGAELGVEGSHGLSLSGRRDMVSEVISDGDFSVMRFRLTAQNTGPLYGIPASGNPLDDWEMGFARFEGDTWVDGWWFKDELGYLLAIGNEEALNFLVD